jgi:uncharacterized protein YndB with AHSA1/START domain
MSKPDFVYVTYIRTTIDKLWEALTTPAFTRQYWYGIEQRSAWTEGASWQLVAEDGRVFDSGEILKVDPPRHVTIAWHHQIHDEMRAEGVGRATYDLETVGDSVKLTITHSGGPKLIAAVAGGWPQILASLKSLLETGRPLSQTRDLPK